MQKSRLFNPIKKICALRAYIWLILLTSCAEPTHYKKFRLEQWSVNNPRDVSAIREYNRRAWWNSLTPKQKLLWYRQHNSQQP